MGRGARLTLKAPLNRMVAARHNGAMPPRAEIVARAMRRTYAALVFLAALFLFAAAAALGRTHAAGAAIFPFLVGLGFAALAPLVWRGRRWAMVAVPLVAAAVGIAIVAETPSEWWIALPLPTTFGLLAAAALATARAPQPEPAGGPVARVFAAATYAYTLVLAMLAERSYTYHLGRPAVMLYVVPFGFVLGALGVLIWRGRIWAMVAATLALSAHWLWFAALDPSFWTNALYAAAPAAAAALAIGSAIADRRDPKEI
jgi:hypothetical protein